MSVFQTAGGPVEFSDTLVDAAIRFAHRQADLTAGALKAINPLNAESPALPAKFLLEFAAVLQIGVWEHRGFGKQLHDAGLPTFFQAAGDLGRRAQLGPVEFTGSEMPALSLSVVQVWMDRFAWESHEYFDCDIMLSEVDEDLFADVLAQFLWDHRHELERLITEGNA